MAPFISTAEWGDFENIINDFANDAWQQLIVWKKCIRATDKLGDDSNPLYKENELRGLVNYNHFRSWPINTQQITGEIDKESILLYLNTKYLADNNYLNANGLLKFNPTLDIFTIDGLEYKASGDSKTSQTDSKTLVNFIILRRYTIDTADSKY